MSSNNLTKLELSLPKGGGAIQGIGETFQTNEFTGTFAFSIPIPTYPCRGFEPKLSIDYSSGSGNGVFGLGFSLSIPNISRKTSKGIPKYDDSDIFLLSNVEDLVPIDGCKVAKKINNVTYNVVSYRPRVEGLFALIEGWTHSQTQETYWRVVSKDNITSIFGKTSESRIVDPESPSRVFQWLLTETYDAKGNHIIYEYKAEDGEGTNQFTYETNHCQTANKYLKRIKYGNTQSLKDGTNPNWLFEVVFDYGEYNLDPNNIQPNESQKWTNRQDPFSTYHAGFEIRTHRLCRQILIFHNFKELGSTPILVHGTRFNYQESPIITLLQSVESMGYRYENGTYQSKKLPPLEFDYTSFSTNNPNFQPIISEKGQSLPSLNLSPNYQLVDLYGEGIPGILYSDGTSTLYWEAAENGEEMRYSSPK